ncbi:2257_t:CDS:2 [Acaulospora colombiana]|uniref:2257_t:CDS:1 n=1 Tax=Acaulospora colombiana TaxID=27376 RepID=A0ACA9M114_9GLOM|nr:2257_t:CDS:2 [Acaulospora colombiana]
METVPITNRRRFMDISPKQEEYIAQQAYRQIIEQYRRSLLPSWDSRTRFVKRVAEKLIGVSGMQGLNSFSPLHSVDLIRRLPFSRKCESEADYIGLLLMAQACYDPEEAIGMWERMNKYQKGVSQFLSTHPNPEYRMKNIRKWMPEALRKRAESDCVHQYDDFRKITDQFRPQWAAW